MKWNFSIVLDWCGLVKVKMVKESSETIDNGFEDTI